MVVASLTLGGLVGVALSGGFVYWEVGRYATPQVPQTLFDERKEVAAYTVGLFVGVPLAVAYLLFVDSMANGALPGALASLGLLVGGTELAQWSLLRSRYWGTGPSGPFYVLGFRAAVGGILALTIVASYAGDPSAITAVGLAWTAAQCLAVVGLEVAGALVSLRQLGNPDRPGGPLRGALIGLVGFFLLGLGPLGGGIAAPISAVLVFLIAGFVYYRFRPLLAEIPAPSGAPPPLRGGPGAYGRTQSGGTDDPPLAKP